MESLGYDDWWYGMAQLCPWCIYDSIILAATKTHQVETSSQHSGGQGMVGLPMEAKEVTLEELEHSFPPPRILEKWHAGEDADWPEPEPLRFYVGQHVLCRTGPTQWDSGTVLQLWYREENWPPNSFAPYKIKLDDGRNIFAPADIDQVIRLNPKKKQPPPPAEEGGDDNY